MKVLSKEEVSSNLLGSIYTLIKSIEGGEKAEGYIDAFELYNLSMKKNLNRINTLFNTPAKELCKEISESPDKEYVYNDDDDEVVVFFLRRLNISREILMKRINFDKTNIKLKENICTSDRVSHELIASSISTVLNKINRCFLKYEGYFFCDNFENGRSKRSVYILADKFDVTLDKYLERTRMRFRPFKSILFQMLFAAVTMQKKYKMSHRDMHMGNIGVTYLSERLRKRKLRFVFGKRKFTIPNPGFFIRIFDYDLSYVGHPYQMISNDTLGLAMYGLKPKFQPGYDIAFIIAHFFSHVLQLRSEKIMSVNYFYSSELDKVYELLSKLISLIYKKLNVKKAIDDFAKFDPGSDETDLSESEKHLFVTSYIRPSKIIADADLSFLIKSNVFRGYMKEYKGEVEIIANVK